MKIKMRTTKIDTKGIPKTTVLAALYNGAVKDGVNNISSQQHMTPDQAEKVLKSVAPRHYVDFYSGRLIKVDLSNGDFFDSYLYDREYGAGHAEEVIAQLRKQYKEDEEEEDEEETAENVVAEASEDH